MSDLVSTLSRRIVSVVSSRSATVMLAASLAEFAVFASLVSAYSTMGGGGAVIRPTAVVAAEVFARSTIIFCLSFILASAGALRNTWFQVALSELMATPKRAAAFLTPSTSAFGTVHTSAFVNGSTWLVALVDRFFRAA